MNVSYKIPTFLALLLFSSISLHAENSVLLPWTMDENYTGRNQDGFNKLKYEVPILLRQTMIDMAVRLGLNFQDGWHYPLTIRFVDGMAYGSENILASVELASDEINGAQQFLNINLTAYAKENFNFKSVFAHELVHAMLTDEIGPDASYSLPVWFHEGIAVYGADQGDNMIRAYLAQNPYANETFLLNGLDGPHNALDYAEDYLVFKYIHDTHGVNSLHNFVREVIASKGDIPGSAEKTCFEDWATFQANFKKFSEETLKAIARDNRGPAGKPY
jgi:hypothetical protein